MSLPQWEKLEIAKGIKDGEHLRMVRDEILDKLCTSRSMIHLH